MDEPGQKKRRVPHALGNERERKEKGGRSKRGRHTFYIYNRQGFISSVPQNATFLVIFLNNLIFNVNKGDFQAEAQETMWTIQ